MRSYEKVDHVRVAAKTAAVVGQGNNAEEQTSCPHPEAGSGQPWKSNRTSADLQRNDGDAQADGQWQQCPEHEANALCIKELRSRRVVDVCNTGAVEADDDVDHDGPEQTNQAGAEKHPADLLMVGRCQPVGNGGQ